MGVADSELHIARFFNGAHICCIDVQTLHQADCAVGIAGISFLKAHENAFIWQPICENRNAVVKKENHEYKSY